MKYPNFNEERKLYKKGYKRIVGLDEVGRGALCGPVVACAFCFIRKDDRNLVSRETRFRSPVIVRDSKKLSFKQREKIYETLKESSDVEWGIGRVSEKVIDRINILQATKLAMKRAVKNLEKKVTESLSAKSDSVTFLLIDGNFGINSDIDQKSIIKADEKVFSCAAASIVAKVTRDKMMLNYHKKYPDYCFDKHKGYGTRVHRDIVKKHGFCKIHRKSFKIS